MCSVLDEYFLSEVDIKYDSPDLLHLSKKIHDTDSLITENKYLQDENSNLKSKLLSIANSTTDITNLYETTKNENLRFQAELKTLQSQLLDLEKEKKVLSDSTYNENILNEQIIAELKQANINLISNELCNYAKILHNNNLLTNKLKRNLKHIVEEQLEHKDGFLWLETAPSGKKVQSKSTSTDNGKTTKDQSIQTNTNTVATVSRGTTTSSFIKTRSIGVNFPDSDTIYIEKIFESMEIPNLLSPINELCIEDETIIKKINAETQTNLKNIRNKLDYVKKSRSLENNDYSLLPNVKKEEPNSLHGSLSDLTVFGSIKDKDDTYINPQLSTLWKILGQTIFSIIGNGQVTNNSNIANIDILTEQVQAIAKRINIGNEMDCSNEKEMGLDSRKRKFHTKNSSTKRKRLSSKIGDLFDNHSNNSFKSAFESNDNSLNNFPLSNEISTEIVNSNCNLEKEPVIELFDEEINWNRPFVNITSDNIILLNEGQSDTNFQTTTNLDSESSKAEMYSLTSELSNSKIEEVLKIDSNTSRIIQNNLDITVNSVIAESSNPSLDSLTDNEEHSLSIITDDELSDSEMKINLENRNETDFGTNKNTFSNKATEDISSVPEHNNLVTQQNLSSSFNEEFLQNSCSFPPKPLLIESPLHQSPKRVTRLSSNAVSTLTSPNKLLSPLKPSPSINLCETIKMTLRNRSEKHVSNNLNKVQPNRLKIKFQNNNIMDKDGIRSTNGNDVTETNQTTENVAVTKLRAVDLKNSVSVDPDFYGFNDNANEINLTENEFYNIFLEIDSIDCNEVTNVLEMCKIPNLIQPILNIIPLENILESPEEPDSEELFKITNVEPKHIPTDRVIANNSILVSPIQSIILNYCTQKRDIILNKIMPPPKNPKESLYYRKICDIITNFINNNPNWTTEACDKVKQSILSVTRNNNVLVRILIDIVETLKYGELNFDFTPPAPPLPRQYQKIISLTEVLLNEEFKRKLIFEVDRRLFTFKTSSCSEKLCSLTYFYIGLVDHHPEDSHKLRMFIYKSLYFYGCKCIPMIYIVLNSYPFYILPKHDEPNYDKRDQLINTIITSLLNIKFSSNKIDYKDLLKKKSLQFFLTKKLGYRFGEHDITKLLQTLLLDLKTNDRTINKNNLAYCFILIGKRQGYHWSVTNIINSHLTPYLNELLQNVNKNNESDQKIIICLFIISSIFKTGDNAEEMIHPMNLFFEILKLTDKQHIQEAAIEAILRLSRFTFIEVFNRIVQWKPNYQISERTLTMMKSFIHRKPLTYWKKI